MTTTTHAASLPSRLLVVGGADGIGNWLVRRVFSRVPDIQRISLLDVKPLDQIPNPLFLREFQNINKEVDALSVTTQHEDTVEHPGWRAIPTSVIAPSSAIPLSAYDAVLIAVPEKQTRDACARVFPSLRQDAWTFDVCSSKVAAIEQMLAEARDGLSVLGTHPLFGPGVSTIVGQTIVLVRTQRTAPAHYAWLSDLCRAQGALVVDADAESHDRYMLYVQALTHFLYLSFAKALAFAMRENSFRLGESFAFMTPPYASIIAFVARIVAAKPRVYAQIQASCGASDVRQLLLRSVRELAAELGEADESKAQAAIQEIIAPFSGKDVGEGVAIAAAYVNRLQAYFSDIHSHRETGDLVVVEVSDPIPGKRGKNVQFHAGVIQGFDHEHLVLKEQARVHNGKWHVIYDPSSRKAFEETWSHRGLKEPQAKEVRIHHKKAHLLPREATEVWRRTYLEHSTFDVPFITAADSKALKALRTILPSVCSDLVDLQVSDIPNSAWLNRYGLANKLLHLIVFGDRSLQDARATILPILQSYGFHIHSEMAVKTS